MANSNGIEKMKKQANEIVDERIEKLKEILKEMPPSPPNPLPSSTQWSSDPDDDDKLYSQMS